VPDVPITIKEKEYHLRYSFPDFEAIEDCLKCGFLFFDRPAVFNSATAMRIFLWRGLKKEAQDGTWIFAFPQDEKGKQEVADLLWSCDIEDIVQILMKIREALTSQTPMRHKEIEKPVKETPKKAKPKNLKT
jgi:hypothetical protein